MSKRDDAELANPAPEGETPKGEGTVADNRPSEAQGFGPVLTPVPNTIESPAWSPTPAPPASGEDTSKPEDVAARLREGAYHNAAAYVMQQADTIARLTRELEEARGRENHALARLDAARAELAEARAEVTRLREAGKQFTDDAREAIATFRRALGGEADALVARMDGTP
jgi:hypothetical protein